MRTPPRYPLRPVADAEPTTDEADMRTGWQKNSKAIGTIIGSTIATLIVGTGGLTGLAHVAGILTTKDKTALEEKIGGVAFKQAASDKVEAEHFKTIDEKLDKLLAPKAKPEPVAKKKRKPVSEE